jgi:hypothetical protein
MATFYHGTSSDRLAAILLEGLQGTRFACPFVTDSPRAAIGYARQQARTRSSEPVVLALELPDIRLQPNGRPAPPFFFDDWHRDSGLMGNAYEYDAPITPDMIRQVDIAELEASLQRPALPTLQQYQTGTWDQDDPATSPTL